MIVKKRNANPTSAIVCGIIALIAAVVVAIMGLQSPPELKNVSEIKAAEMSDDYSYYFEDLIVFDHYMTITSDDSDNGKYYIVGFEGEDGKFYLASIFADKNSSMKNTLWNYASDPDTLIGDLSISGCFKTRKVSSIKDMGQFYDTTAATAIKLVRENWGKSAQDLQLHFDFVCEDPADYEEEASMSFLLIVAAVFVVLGGVMIFFGNKAKKKLKAEEEARARFNESQPQEPIGPEF